MPDSRLSVKHAALPGTLSTTARAVITTVALGLAVAGAYLVAMRDYLLFHSFAELFVVVIAIAAFLIAWNSRHLFENNYILILAASLFFTAIILVFHILAYKGMSLFADRTANLPTQLWLASRYVLVTGLIAAPLLARRRRSTTLIIGFFLVITVGLLTAIFTGRFPTAFDPAAGITVFKFINEYVFVLMFGVSILLIRRIRQLFDTDIYRLIVAAIGALVFTELAFTLYIDPYGVSNLVGHYLQIIALYLFYRALIQTGLVKPFSFILRELKAREVELEHASTTDRLTRLYNSSYFLDKLKSEMLRAERYRHNLSLMVIDFDDFKIVNDTYGHLSGDRALRAMGTIIQSNLRRVDVAARYGGDEFMVLLPETALAKAVEVAERIRADTAGYAFKNDQGETIGPKTVSIGLAECSGYPATRRDFIKAADTAMYQAKSAGRNTVVAVRLDNENTPS